MTKKTFFLFILIFLLGLYLRLYRFSNTFTLETDQVQSLILADKIINRGHIILLGYGPNSINIITPLFHYIITVIFFFFRNEFAVTLAVAFINIVSIFMLFIATRYILGAKSALLTTLFYTLSFGMIKYSRSIFDPYLVPLFFLSSIYLLFVFIKNKGGLSLIGSWINILLAMMYISTFLVLPGYLLLIFLNLKRSARKKKILMIFLLLLIFFLFYSTVFYYHFKSGFKEFTLLFSNLTHASFNLTSFFIKFFNSILKNIFLLNQEIFQAGYFSIFNIFSISILFILFCTKLKKISQRKNFLFLTYLFFLPGLILTGIYTENNFTHRLGPIIILYLIIFPHSILQLKKNLSLPNIFFNIITFIILFFLFIPANINKLAATIYQPDSPFEIALNQTKYINKNIGENYSLFVSTPDEKTNYNAPEYLYFLSKLRKIPVPIRTDMRGELYYNFNTQKKFLILVCQDYSNDSLVISDCLNNFFSQFGFKHFETKKKFNDTTIFIFSNNSQRAFIQNQPML